MNKKIPENQIIQYRNELETIKKIHPYLPQPRKRPLTIPEIFGKSYDENFISDYLAYILHPQKNGIGIEAAVAMLKLIGIEIEIDDSSHVEIIREHHLGRYGRIDLLILVDETYAIGIENKIFSNEGLEQTNRYVKALEKELDSYQLFFIFLSPTSSKPSSRKFKPISYRQLHQALARIQYDWAKDVHKSVIWKDFLIHLEHYITMRNDNLNISEKGKLYIEHFQMIEDIKKAYEQDASDIFDYVANQIERELQDQNLYVDFKKNRFYQLIYKESWRVQQPFVHFEFWFNLNSLAQSKFQFMIDVERKGKSQFLKLFDAEYATLQNQYKQHNIDYRPSHRKYAIAWKVYEMEDMVENIAHPFIQSIKEFFFLTETIDLVYEKLSLQRKQRESSRPNL